MSIADALLIVGAASGILSLVITAWRERNKPTVDSANASSVNTAANIALIEPLTKRIDEMENEIAAMRGELEDLRLGVGILTAQLIEVGRTPRWKPRNSSTTAKPVTGFKR